MGRWFEPYQLQRMSRAALEQYAASLWAAQAHEDNSAIRRSVASELKDLLEQLAGRKKDIETERLVNLKNISSLNHLYIQPLEHIKPRNFQEALAKMALDSIALDNYFEDYADVCAQWSSADLLFDLLTVHVSLRSSLMGQYGESLEKANWLEAQFRAIAPGMDTHSRVVFIPANHMPSIELYGFGAMGIYYNAGRVNQWHIGDQNHEDGYHAMSQRYHVKLLPIVRPYLAAWVKRDDTLYILKQYGRYD